MLVHLPVLALAAVRLDERLLLRDLDLAGLGVAAQARVPLLALAGVGRVVAAERGEAPVAQLPDAGHRRVEEGPVVGGDEEGAAAAPDGLLEPLDGGRGPGGSSARRGGAGPRSATRRRASAARVCWPPESSSGERAISSGVNPSPESASSTRWSSVQPSSGGEPCGEVRVGRACRRHGPPRAPAARPPSPRRPPPPGGRRCGGPAPTRTPRRNGPPGPAGPSRARGVAGPRRRRARRRRRRSGGGSSCRRRWARRCPRAPPPRSRH